MEPGESTFDFAQGSLSIACHPIYSPAWGVSRLTRRKARVVRENLLEEDLSCEPQQHWRVRDALAFTPKALRGDVLVKLLKDSDPHLRESALLALRRLVPIHWVHHVDMVSAMLIDRTPEVRIAALLVLFELDVRDLDLQAGASASRGGAGRSGAELGGSDEVLGSRVFVKSQGCCRSIDM